MTELNYTKGEWEARKLLPDKHGIITKEAWEITTPEYDVVAQIIGSAPIRKEVDAHLIAAAPEMYKALKLLTERFESMNGKYQYPMSLDLPRVYAERALAKAEGK